MDLTTIITNHTRQWSYRMVSLVMPDGTPDAAPHNAAVIAPTRAERVARDLALAVLQFLEYYRNGDPATLEPGEDPTPLARDGYAAPLVLDLAEAQRGLWSYIETGRLSRSHLAHLLTVAMDRAGFGEGNPDWHPWSAAKEGDEA